MTVGFILLDEFTLAAFGGMVDVLRLAADHGGRSRQIHAGWKVMSVGGESRRSSCGVNFSPLLPLADPGEFDYIAVCGGNDYMNDRVEPELLDYLHSAAARRVRLLGVCTGTFTIARVGLADGRNVCVHWNVLDEFRRRFPKVTPDVHQIFIDEGDLITCAGSTAAIDLGLYLVNRHCGSEKARQAMRHMMLQEMRAPKVPQPHFYSELPVVEDLRVRQAVKFILERLDDPPRLEVIARYVGVGVRQLERAFKASLSMSPYSFHRQVRLRYAQWLLSETELPVTRIAIDCGFADGAHFSRDFRSFYGASPAQYRRDALAGSAGRHANVNAEGIGET